MVDPNREPVAPYVFEWKKITGKHSGSPAAFTFALNAGKNAGIGSRARFVYDFDGDGKGDRIETFQLFATDPVESSWETYSSKNQGLDEGLSSGDMRDFAGGSVRLEFWKCFGEGSVDLKLADSRVELPIGPGVGKVPGAEATVTVGGDTKPLGVAKVFYAKGSVLGVTLNGSSFALFAPTGTDWSVKPGDTTDALVTKLVHFQMSNYLSNDTELAEAKTKLIHRYELITKRINALADFSSYCGIGYGTPVGMGMLRRLCESNVTAYQPQIPV